MRRRSKVPIVLAALLFLLGAVAEIATSRSVNYMGVPEMAPHTPQHSSRFGGAEAFVDTLEARLDMTMNP
jgi:hypothetical protein